MDTQMHMVTFTIIAFETVVLLFQVIYFLERPSDNKRLLYLVLLVLLILHNIASGLFPDPTIISLSVRVQNVVAYLVAFAMSMYCVYYFYRAFELKQLRFFAIYGSIFFLLLPFIFLFVIPYYLTGDLMLSRKLSVVVPFIYGLVFIGATTYSFKLKFTEEGYSFRRKYPLVIAAYIALLSWVTLPIIVYFGDFQVLEHSVTNSGFLVLTVVYIHSSINQSREEYNNLLISEKSLQQLNSDLQKKVEERTAKLETLIEKRKTTFINLAHETKTPLTLINNYLNDYIIRKGEDKELNLIMGNIQKLTSDMVNFFDIETFDKGFGVYNHEHVSNISTLVSDKVPLFKVMAVNKGVIFGHSIEPDLYTKANPGALERIFNNLIENAIKYSPAGKAIDVSLEKQSNHAVFVIKDEGYGIPRDMLARVFEPYFKLSIPGQSIDGMGMGLSIVKKIVDDLLGEISIESEVGRGTTVTVSLLLVAPDIQSILVQPFLKADYKNATTIEQPDNSFDNKNRPRVLLVEDNEEMLQYMTVRLSRKYIVHLSRNGLEALTKLNEIERLDLIISDVMMNVMDGFELCKRIAESPHFNHIPIILLTAKTTPSDKFYGLKLGALDYIEKPFVAEHLMLKVDSLLENFKRQRVAMADNAYKTLLLERKVDERDRQEDSFERNCLKYKLTEREVEIIKEVIKGTSYKVIASQLFISEKTVARHIANIFLKVSVSNKVELINKLESTG